jgi:uridine kinase
VRQTPEEQLVSGVRELVRTTATPVVVAIDGRRGAGKSTLPRSLARTLGAAVIEGDDFYAGGSAEQWDMMSPAARADHDFAALLPPEAFDVVIGA